MLTGSGLATLMLVGGIAAAFGLVILRSPIAAILLFLVTSFAQIALPSFGLPVALDSLAFAALVGAVVVATMQRTLHPPPLGAVELTMLVFLVWNIGSAVAPHLYPPGDPGRMHDFSVPRFILTSTVIPFSMYFLARFVLDRETAIRRLLWTITGLAAYSVAVSIMQFHGPAALVWPRFIVEAPKWEGRAVGVFNQPVVNGLILIVGFVVAVFLANNAETARPRRIAAYVLALTSLYAIYLTHTRAVWLAFAVVLVVGALRREGRAPGRAGSATAHTTGIRGPRRFFAVTLTIIVLLIAANWTTFTSSDRDAGGITSASEVNDRLNIMATALWATDQKPVLGWGLGRFTYVNTYHHQQWSPEVDWQRGYGYASHENELGIAAELGLVGLGLWLSVVVLLGRQLYQALKNLPEHEFFRRELVFIASVAFFVWLVMGTTVDLRFLDFANALLMTLVGAAVGFAGAASKPVGQPPPVLTGRAATPPAAERLGALR